MIFKKRYSKTVDILMSRDVIEVRFTKEYNKSRVHETITTKYYWLLL
jgi:hypothetical protein